MRRMGVLIVLGSISCSESNVGKLGNADAAAATDGASDQNATPGKDADAIATGGLGGSAGATGSAGQSGQGGQGGQSTGNATCAGSDWSVYSSPGCGADTPQPRCVSSRLLCIQTACGCDGTVLMGCHDFSAPFAYASPLGPSPTGTTCDPNAMGGQGGSESPPPRP